MTVSELRKLWSSQSAADTPESFENTQKKFDRHLRRNKNEAWWYMRSKNLPYEHSEAVNSFITSTIESNRQSAWELFLKWKASETDVTSSEKHILTMLNTEIRIQTVEISQNNMKTSQRLELPPALQPEIISSSMSAPSTSGLSSESNNQPPSNFQDTLANIVQGFEQFIDQGYNSPIKKNMDPNFAKEIINNENSSRMAFMSTADEIDVSHNHTSKAVHFLNSSSQLIHISEEQLLLQSPSEHAEKIEETFSFPHLETLSFAADSEKAYSIKEVVADNSLLHNNFNHGLINNVFPPAPSSACVILSKNREEDEQEEYLDSADEKIMIPFGGAAHHQVRSSAFADVSNGCDKRQSDIENLKSPRESNSLLSSSNRTTPKSKSILSTTSPSKLSPPANVIPFTVLSPKLGLSGGTDVNSSATPSPQPSNLRERILLSNGSNPVHAVPGVTFSPCEAEAKSLGSSSIHSSDPPFGVSFSNSQYHPQHLHSSFIPDEYTPHFSSSNHLPMEQLLVQAVQHHESNHQFSIQNDPRPLADQNHMENKNDTLQQVHLSNPSSFKSSNLQENDNKNFAVLSPHFEIFQDDFSRRDVISAVNALPSDPSEEGEEEEVTGDSLPPSIHQQLSNNINVSINNNIMAKNSASTPASPGFCPSSSHLTPASLSPHNFAHPVASNSSMVSSILSASRRSPSRALHDLPPTLPSPPSHSRLLSSSSASGSIRSPANCIEQDEALLRVRNGIYMSPARPASSPSSITRVASPVPVHHSLLIPSNSFVQISPMQQQHQKKQPSFETISTFESDEFNNATSSILPKGIISHRTSVNLLPHTNDGDDISLLTNNSDTKNTITSSDVGAHNRMDNAQRALSNISLFLSKIKLSAEEERIASRRENAHRALTSLQQKLSVSLPSFSNSTSNEVAYSYTNDLPAATPVRLSSTVSLSEIPLSHSQSAPLRTASTPPSLPPSRDPHCSSHLHSRNLDSTSERAPCQTSEDSKSLRARNAGRAVEITQSLIADILMNGK